MTSDGAERHRTKINYSYGSIATSFGLFTASIPVAHDDPFNVAQKLRNWLPHPINIFDHISNLGGSAVLGSIAGVMIAENAARLANSRSEEHGGRYHGGVLGTAGLILGLTVNTVMETKLGASVFGPPNAIDYVYGVVGATAAAATSSQVELRISPSG